MTEAQMAQKLSQAGIAFDHLHIGEGRCQIEIYCRRFNTLKRQLASAGFEDIQGCDCKSWITSESGNSWNWMALAHFPVPATPALSTRLQQAFERARRMIGGAA